MSPNQRLCMYNVKFLATLVLSSICCASITANAAVVINEVMANNLSAVPNGNDYPDWVELYNTGPGEADLSGSSLTDNLSQPAKYLFPAGTKIEAGGYLLVWCDSATSSPGLHTGFSFNSSGEEVGLFAPASQGSTRLDSVTFGIQPPNFSIGRVPNGTGAFVLTIPSPLRTNVASLLGSTKILSINEWMASPLTGDDWLELANADSLPVALGGMVFSDKTSTPSTNRPIAALSYIAPEGFIQFMASGLSKNDPDHLDFKLGSKGETITLFATDRTTQVAKIKFDKQEPNISQGRLPDNSDSLVFFPAGKATPGASNFQPITNVIINEVLTHTDLPIEDTVELFNPTDAPVDISNWWLSNSPTDAKKYRIPAGTILQPGGFQVFYEYQFNPDGTGNAPSFRFNSAHGDECFLYSADAAGNLTGGRVGLALGSAEHGVSFGWIYTSEGPRFVPLARRTFGVDVKVTDPASTVLQYRQGKGMTNSEAKVWPLVISEIMYHPSSTTAGVDNTADEYIELYNNSAQALPLFNILNPRLSPTNSYRLDGAVQFELPLNRVLGPQGHVLIVPFNPETEPARLAAFQQKYRVPTDVQVFGPYRGRLNNGGGILDLYKPDEIQGPDHPDYGFTPLLLIERIHFNNLPPWPAEADGNGSALQRVRLDGYGGDPANWIATPPTPGTLAAPRIDLVERVGTQVKITFTAAAGAGYGVQASTALSGAPWVTIGTATPDLTTRSVTVTETPAANTAVRYYRLITPP